MCFHRDSIMQAKEYARSRTIILKCLSYPCNVYLSSIWSKKSKVFLQNRLLQCIYEPIQNYCSCSISSKLLQCHFLSFSWTNSQYALNLCIPWWLCSETSFQVDCIIFVACGFVSQNNSILNDLICVCSSVKDSNNGAWSEANTSKDFREIKVNWSEISGEIRIRSSLEWVGSGLLLHQVNCLFDNGTSTNCRSRIKSLDISINLKLLWFSNLWINHLTKLKSPPIIHECCTSDAIPLITSIKPDFRSSVEGP